ncbi:hypothetical protein, partial [Enterobacter hormaechei]
PSYIVTFPTVNQYRGDPLGYHQALQVKLDVTGLDVIEPRKNTFLILNTKDLIVSKRIVKSGRSCG